MERFNSRLIYNGTRPVHTLAADWMPGSVKTLDELFATWGEKCPGSKVPDEDFADWFFHNYVKSLGSSWKFIKDRGDFIATASVEDVPSDEEVVYVEEGSELATEVAEALQEQQQPVYVESSTVGISASEAEAKERLRASRHPSEVGTVQREAAPSMEHASDKAIKVKTMAKPGSQTMSGDDLDAAYSLQQSVSHRGAAVLEVEGYTTDESVGKVASRPAVPTAQAVQRERDAQLSEVVNNSTVLEPTTVQGSGYRSQIVEGGSNPPASTQTTIKNATADGEIAVDPRFHSMSGTEARETTVSDIANNPDEAHAKQLVKNCKNVRTLKIARNACYNQGKQGLVEAISNRISNLPLRSMS